MRKWAKNWEGMIKYAKSSKTVPKICEGMRKCATSYEITRKCAKTCESMRKCALSWEIVLKLEKVW